MNSDYPRRGTPWRTKRSKLPYQRPRALLSVPKSALLQSLGLFREYAERELESCCFWYGFLDQVGNGRVAAVVVPRQQNSWGNYHVSSQSMVDVSAATRDFGWRNLSQIHTHPGRWVEHSPYDDEQANSRKALSLVFPFYGVWDLEWPEGIGVHEFQNEFWNLLSLEDSAARIRITQEDEPIQLIDLR